MKIKKENVAVGKANQIFTTDFLNSPVFKKAKPILLKAKKTKYVPPTSQ